MCGVAVVFKSRTWANFYGESVSSCLLIATVVCYANNVPD